MIKKILIQKIIQRILKNYNNKIIKKYNKQFNKVSYYKWIINKDTIPQTNKYKLKKIIQVSHKNY